MSLVWCDLDLNAESVGVTENLLQEADYTNMNMGLYQEVFLLHPYKWGELLCEGVLL